MGMATCECGCGAQVCGKTWRGPRRFLPGHNLRLPGAHKVRFTPQGLRRARETSRARRLAQTIDPAPLRSLLLARFGTKNSAATWYRTVFGGTQGQAWLALWRHERMTPAKADAILRALAGYPRLPTTAERRAAEREELRRRRNRDAAEQRARRARKAS